MTRQDRIAKVTLAVAELNAGLLEQAILAEGQPREAAAWAAVEAAGAVIHRQARLLAGKPRGG